MTGLQILMQIHITENVTLCVVSIKKKTFLYESEIYELSSTMLTSLNINFEHFTCSFVLYKFPIEPHKNPQSYQ